MKKILFVGGWSVVVLVVICIIVGIFLGNRNAHSNTIFPNRFTMYFMNEDDIAKKLFEKAIKALDNGDVEGLRKLFAPNAIDVTENFEDELDEIFEYYRGEYISCEYKNAMNSELTQGEGKVAREASVSCDFETTEEIYRMALTYKDIDTAEPDNVGVWSLYIIRLEDDLDKDSVYRGDFKSIPGINIGVREDGSVIVNRKIDG